jgi:hypothetical protein
VTSISVGKKSLDDPPRLLQLDGVSVFMVCGAEGAGEGNRLSRPEATATLEPRSRGSVISDSAHGARSLVDVSG